MTFRPALLVVLLLITHPACFGQEATGTLEILTLDKMAKAWKAYYERCTVGDVTLEIVGTKVEPRLRTGARQGAHTEGTPSVRRSVRFAWGANKYHVVDESSFWFDGERTFNIRPPDPRLGIETVVVLSGERYSFTLFLGPWWLTGRSLILSKHSLAEFLDGRYPIDIDRMGGDIRLHSVMPADDVGVPLDMSVWLSSENQYAIRRIHVAYDVSGLPKDTPNLNKLALANWDLNVTEYREIPVAGNRIHFPIRGTYVAANNSETWEVTTVSLSEPQDLRPVIPEGAQVTDSTDPKTAKRFQYGTAKRISQPIDRAVDTVRKDYINNVPVHDERTRFSAATWAWAVGLVVLVFGICILIRRKLKS